MMDRITGRMAAAVALALGIATGPVAAMAQDAGEVSRDEAQAFAVAAVEIREITQAYSARIMQLDAGPERRALIEEADGHISAVFDASEELDRARYHEIAEAAGADEDLAERLTQRIAEVME
jgi:hypothetical protein